MKRLLLSSIILFTYLQASANHFSGAYINYQHVSGAIYRVNIYLYKTCESSAIDLPTFTKVKLVSALSSVEISKNLPLTKLDTLNQYCSGTTNTCQNLSAQYPGYIIGTYSDTMVVPNKANDWRFTLLNGTRNAGMTNIASSSSQSFYTEASLDNSIYPNSNVVFPNEPPNVLFVNDSTKVPLNGYDPDGDRIEYVFIPPLYDHQKSITYYSGYSSTIPFGNGGSCYFDTANNMILKSPATGKYTIAVRVREYRGSRLMSESVLDFVVICVNAASGNGLSTPYPTSVQNKEIYTCPGKTNTLKFSFTDPVATDNVTLDIEPPNISGWNFNTSTNNGTGIATGSITWQTPTNLNPATLPLFYIKAHVKDNGCTQIGKATYVYKVITESCLADSVWPGDANSDNIVNLYDPLAIAMNYGDTGVQRPNASNSWQGQSCDFWNGSFLNNIDKKHSDCNGDGKVDTSDINAIITNYSKTHNKGGMSKTTGAYDLTFDHNGITANPDSSVSIKMLLNGQVNNLYGLAANISISGLSFSNLPTISYENTWLGDTTNTLRFTKEININSIDWAYARTDKQNKSGQGQLATINFTIPSNTPDGQMVILNYSNAKLIDKEGKELTDFDVRPDTFYVSKPATGIYNHVPSELVTNIYPNPGKDHLVLQLNNRELTETLVVVKDITGKMLLRKQNKSSINNTMIINTQELPKGFYLIEISNGSDRQTVRWTKI